MTSPAIILVNPQMGENIGASARAIANYLSIQGVSASQIETISYGEEKPAALGHSEAAWSKNRRVELIYVD